jgi:DNA polymerase III subunit epsilon
MLRGLAGRRAHGAARAYATAAAPSMRSHWRGVAYCVIDLELSGLDPRQHEIISFGAVPIEDGRVRLDGALSSLVAPTRPLSEPAIRVHGIRAADLDGAPPLAEAVEMLLGALAGRVLVAHHADVERAFLGPALRRARVRLRGPIVDSAHVTRLWLAERDGALPRQLPLSELARRCGLPAHSPHTAIGDALTTAQLFLASAEHLDARRPQTLRELTRAGLRLRELSAYGPITLPAPQRS